jgi:cytochrome b561
MTTSEKISPESNASHESGSSVVSAVSEANDQGKNPSYGRFAIFLHWVLAALIIYQLALGLWMIDLPKSPVGLRAGWFNWHKSMGLMIGLVMCLRLIWRLSHPVQADGIRLSLLQLTVSRLNHFGLYVCLLLMPLSGFLGSNFTPYPVKFFGLVLPRLMDPSPELKAWCSVVHEWTSYTLLLLITLHLMGALWHALKKDGVLSRMGLQSSSYGEKIPD